MEEVNIERFVIPAFKVEKFENRAEKIKKKADRLDVLFAYSISDDPQKTTITVNGQDITVKGRKVAVAGTQKVQIEGCNVISKVEFHDDGNVLKGRDLNQEVFEEFKDTDATRCDHCGHSRQRKEGFIVTDGDETNQVGSSCLKDFTGHPDAVSLAETYSEVAQFVTSAQNPVFRGGEPFQFNTETVLAVGCKCIRQNGYKKSTQCPSTKNMVEDIILSPNEDHTEFPDKRDWDRANNIINWAEGIEATNSYMNNVKILCQLDRLEDKDLGIVVSAPVAYERDTREESDFSGSEWVGNEGERLEGVTAEVVFTKHIQKNRCNTPYDDSFTIVKFLTEDGNVLVWFTGSTPFFNLEDESGIKMNSNADSVDAGKDKKSLQLSITELDGVEGLTVNIRCTVKDHDEYQGTKQTKVSRVYFEGSDSVDHFEKV